MAPQTRQRAGTEYDACWPVWEAIKIDDDDDGDDDDGDDGGVMMEVSERSIHPFLHLCIYARIS